MLCGLNVSCSRTHLQTRRLRLLEGGIEVLDERLLRQSGPFKTVRRWLRGKHPQLGILHMGYTGWETIVETDLIVPTGVFAVTE